MKDRPCKTKYGYDNDICIDNGCYGIVCELQKRPDYSIIETTVVPLFARAFKVQGNYNPTLWEKLFGRKANAHHQ